MDFRVFAILAAVAGFMATPFQVENPLLHHLIPYVHQWQHIFEVFAMLR